MTPGPVAYQAPPSMGFSRQEYWSGVPLPSLLSTAKRGILRDLTIIVDLSIYLCSSISFALCVLKLSCSLYTLMNIVNFFDN